MSDKPTENEFFNLSMDKVVDAVESAMKLEKPGMRATGRALALNSLENRVYQIEMEDSSYVVAKFYRPGRWSEDQILDEHEFLDRLEEVEVPVVSPFSLAVGPKSLETNSETLARSEAGIYFAVFPKVRGRLSDELKASQLETLGRYIARVHEIGRSWTPEHRLRLDSEAFLSEPLNLLRSEGFLKTPMGQRYESLATSFYPVARARLASANFLSLHGDCHLGNVLWEGEAPFLMDFDDMCIGPAVQDVWMVVRGRDEDALKSREAFLSGYEQMSSFDYSELSLIEILRGIRVIHYSAWIARRWADPSFRRAFPDFGSESYWRAELEALSEILDLL